MQNINRTQALVGLLCLATNLLAQSSSLTALVNPFIGTDAHGHTHPAATMPFGMVQLGPNTRSSMMDWDGCSGYHYSDSLLYGFSHTHLSGTGVPDYNDVLVRPFTSNLNLDPASSTMHFRKSAEKATPGYYSVHLTDADIYCEMTASERVGVHRYTYPSNTEAAKLLVDLRHRDEVLESGLNLVSSQEISGYRISKSWAERQTLFFVLRFSQPLSQYQLLDLTQNPPKAANSVANKACVGVFHFNSSPDPLVVTVGISSVSIEGARKNLEAECPDFDFDRIRDQANTAWERYLSKIVVQGGSTAEQTSFYTALYHTAMAPNLWSDVDGYYRGMDQKIHHAYHPVYTVFSLWDTYRAANPLHALLEPQRMRDFIRTFLLQYQQGGLLPVWELAANETNCMIGNHAIPVILDAYTKGLVAPSDAPLLLAAMQKSAELNRLGLKQYRQKGYIPANEEPESVSKTLEYTFDDWCISTMAAKLGKKNIADLYAQRATHYRNLFDPQTRFFRGKSNGTWHSPFDPVEVNFNFTEANAWQYRFSIQHDVPGMVSLFGGPSNFLKELDRLFDQPSQTTGRNQADITGLIGQYAHGNEPCHHVAYLYSLLGQPEKTRKRVQQIRSELYTNQPDGLCGNDDCGQMSAWYVWSSIGMYPLTPGSEEYVLGIPAFDKITLQLPQGKKFQITSNSHANQIHLNQQPWKLPTLQHQQLISGGLLDFILGKEEKNNSITLTNQVNARPMMPFISSGNRVFTDKQTIRLDCADKEATIFYQLNGQPFQPYKDPVQLEQNSTLVFFSEKDGQKSFPDTTLFFKKTNDLKVLEYQYPFSPQYTGGGMDALVDLLPGGADFRSGGWQGFEGKNLEVVLDLGKKQSIQQVDGHFFQDENAWIFFPTSFQVESSIDGRHFQKIGVLENTIPPTEKGLLQKHFTLSFPAQETRYLRVTAVNRGLCPDGHKGAGYPSWIFIDEIKIQ